MLDVGFSEILLTSAIALIVLGPERLPKVARQVGNWMGRARSMARQLSEQLEREVSAEELLKQTVKPKASESIGASLPPAPASEAPLTTEPALPPVTLDSTSAVDAESTTAAAMHPSDTSPAPPHE